MGEFLKKWWPMISLVGGGVITAVSPTIHGVITTFVVHNPELSAAAATILGGALHMMKSPTA